MTDKKGSTHYPLNCLLQRESSAFGVHSNIELLKRPPLLCVFFLYVRISSHASKILVLENLR